MDDLVSRRAAIEAIDEYFKRLSLLKRRGLNKAEKAIVLDVVGTLNSLPSVQPTLYGYNIEHLELIARVLQKENLPPERIVEVLTDIGRIVAIVRDEFEEALRKAVEQ